MATTTPAITKRISPELQHALDDGVLTDTQLRELIALQAATLGLDFDEAVRGAYADTLPRNATGADLRLLVSMLPS